MISFIQYGLTTNVFLLVRPSISQTNSKVSEVKPLIDFNHNFQATRLFRQKTFPKYLN